MKNCTMMRLLTFMLSILINKFVEGEGFVAGTLIRTRYGHVPIEQLKVNDQVISYNFENATLMEGKIVKISRKRISKLAQLRVNNQLLEGSCDNKFYSPSLKNNWTPIGELKKGYFLLTNAEQTMPVDYINEIEKEIDVYCLSIQNYHNFFVSEQNILVHNFFAIPILIPIIAWIMANFEFSLAICVGGALFATKGLTNQEARKKAKEWGYVEDKNPPFYSHGKPAFKDPKRNVWISADADGHNGGVWKEFTKDKRKATLDEEGNIIKG